MEAKTARQDLLGLGNKRKESRMRTKIKLIGVVLLATLLSVTILGIGQAETPKRGGDLVSGYGQFPRHFNHAIQSGAATASPKR